MLKEEAIAIKEQLQNGELDGFSSSNGWLGCWKTTYSVKDRRIVGETEGVSTETVTSWMEGINKLTKSYSLENVWNMSNLSVVFKALLDKELVKKGKQAKGGKKSKQRLTVAFFFVNFNVLGKRSTNPLSSGRVNSHAVLRNCKISLAQLMFTIFRILNLG